MSVNTLAPWAELVSEPDVLLTAEDLLRLPNDARGYELIEGRLVRTMSPAAGRHGTVGGRLAVSLGAYVETHGLGQIFAAGTGFFLSLPSQPDTVLAPDLAFIRNDRLPPGDDPSWDRFLRIAPDLVVEIASPGQSYAELDAKARCWLDAGVRLVWIVWPSVEQIRVWRPGASLQPTILTRDDQIEGAEVVSGFVYALSSLFTIGRARR